jgi:small subunit ribosomal protein S15
MSITAQRKQDLIGEYRRGEQDTGSPEVQVAILTDRIKAITAHLKTNRHDYSTRRGLFQMVSKRQRLLRYLASQDRGKYQDLIQRLGLRR